MNKLEKIRILIGEVDPYEPESGPYYIGEIEKVLNDEITETERYQPYLFEEKEGEE